MMNRLTLIPVLLGAVSLSGAAIAQDSEVSEIGVDDLISEDGINTQNLFEPEITQAEATQEVSLHGAPDLIDLDNWAADGAKTVINTLTPRETAGLAFNLQEEVEARGMAYVHVPVSSRTSGTETTDALTQALAYVEGPIALHCRSGHRVAHLYAAHLIRTGELDRSQFQSVDPTRQFDEDLLSRLLGEDTE